METHADIIEELGGYAAIADGLTVPHGTVSAWKARRSIPVQYWAALVEFAETKGHGGIDLTTLARLAQPRRKTTNGA